MSYSARRVTLRVCAAVGRRLPVALIAFAVLQPHAAHAQTLPAELTGSNIGSATPTGRATHASGTFTVEAGGSRIGSTSDQFYFVHQQITGNATIIARVGSIENTNARATAGVMIRESLANNARHALALVTPTSGAGFHHRTSTGGTTTTTNVSGVTAPVWLRLVRSGSAFTASRSTNGSSWTTIGSATISMSSTVYVGLAVSSYNTSTLATGAFTNVGITASLPSGWTAADVGTMTIPASSNYASGVFTLAGAGADMVNTTDHFRFVHRRISGDVDIIARLDSFDPANDDSESGIMIRSTLYNDSAHASMLFGRRYGVTFHRRPGAGLNAMRYVSGPSTTPVWFKLERRGSAVTGYRSTNGTSWTMVGSETLTLPSTFYVGVVVSAYTTTATATARFSSVSIGAPSSTPAPTPPTVSLTSPAAGSTYTAPATVNLAANASDADGVSQVEFYASGTLLGTDTTSPYAFTWSGAEAGSYSLTAVARDTRGAVATSSAASITVNALAGNTPPTVALTAPAAGSTYTAPASVTISATASDTGGSIARVDFYAGSTLVGSDTTSPYSVTWINAGAGSYSITAVAQDNLGARTTSAARSISIGDPTMPTRAIFGASPDHTTVTRYVLDVFTAGANPATATPMATQNLGKPAVVNGECNADIAATISGLPGGNYFATVVAVSSGGTSTRTVSSVFAR